eukprot:PhF_6_TR17399/c0_g1_i1/m.26633
MADNRAVEETNLKLKFTALNYTTQRKEQKMRERSPERCQAMNKQSYSIWKRINPGYLPEEKLTTTAKETQDMEADDFVVTNRENYRKRDKHTEYVDYVVRDKALARGHQ